MRAAIIYKQDDNSYIVENIIEVSAEALEPMRIHLNADYAIPVGVEVECGNIYEPSTGVFYNECGDRVYPPMSTEEELTRIKTQLEETQLELEMTQSAVIELAELVAGGE